MITTRLTPLSVALFAACSWFQRHPELTADPDILLDFVSAWVVSVGPKNVKCAEACGISAAEEVAECRKDSPLATPEVLNPEDLMD